MRKRKKRVARFLSCFFTIIIVGAVIYIVYTKFDSNKSHTLDSINGFSYTIESHDTVLMKDKFALLKESLQVKEIDYEKYAEYLAELFVIDLYTLDNKSNKYDIGGYEYVYPEKVDNYKLKVQDTLYRYLENDTDRKQDLPIVSNIKMESIEESTYTYNEMDYEAYNVNLSWEYVKDYDYDTQANITLMKDGKFLYVVEFSPEVEE